jgi:hypothetical protein
LTAESPINVLKLLKGTDPKNDPGLIARIKKEKLVLYIDDLAAFIKPEDSKQIDTDLEEVKAILLSGEVPVFSESTGQRFLTLDSQLGDASRRLERIDVSELANGVEREVDGKKIKVDELFDSVANSAVAIEEFRGVKFDKSAYYAAITAGKRFSFGRNPLANPGAALDLLQRVAVEIRHSQTGNSGILAIDAAAFNKALEQLSSGGYRTIDLKVLQTLEENISK